MKLIKFFVVTFILGFILIPNDVFAENISEECSYHVDPDSLSSSNNSTITDSTINCTFNYNDGFFGGFSYSCEYIRGDFDANITILNINSERNTGFSLGNWFEDNKKCPNYLVFETSSTTYAADTIEQVNTIKEQYGDDFINYGTQFTYSYMGGGEDYEQTGQKVID